MKRIAINGFGRIGRLTFRNLLNKPDVEVVAINDLTDNATLAHLLKRDSAQGVFNADITYDSESITVNGHKIAVSEQRDPALLPWNELGVDIVLECTGRFRNRETAGKHLTAGATKVIISAPAKDASIKTIVLGVNEDQLDNSDTIVSNASCTTNCLSPAIKIIDENWGLEQASVTTIHAYTADQRLQDAPHDDLRRARAAAINIVPTTTGAVAATAKVYPAAKGKLMAIAVRVPVITGSLTEINAIVQKDVSVDEINSTFKKYADTTLKGILQYSTEELVSTDIIGNKHSGIFDSKMSLVEGKLMKLVVWYDNEAGYSARLADLAEKI